eukprot:m.219276 g.219276  ORF g.219276 m.219276 type:complete len:91 (+) comp18694_c0_seq4:1009-1281(+)
MFFFRMHNPTTLNRQGWDMGTQYRSVIFVEDAEQEKVATAVRDEVQASKQFNSDVVTQVVVGGSYFPAEEYHQRYLEKNPGGYCNHKLYF